MPRILGLDLAHGAVRGTLIRTTLRRTEVLGYAEASLEPAGDDPVSKAEALRAAAHDVIARFGPRPPDGVVAELDGQDASLRIVELPAAASKRIGEVLPFELEALLPFPIEDAVLDYQPIERSADTVRLMATAAPRAKVAARLEELQDLGQDPRELAVGAAALDGLLPILPSLQGPTTSIVVDVGEETSDVCVLRDDRCQLARTLSTGMAQVRAGRRTALEIQLKHTLASYRASGGPEPEVVYLAGAAASFPNATEWLASVTGIETRILPLPPVSGADDAGRPRFARATALAGRSATRGKRIDMRQGEFARRRAAGVVRQHARLMAICAAVVLLSFGFSSYARWAILADEREALQAELASVTDELFDTETTDPDKAEELLTGEAGPPDPLPSFDAFDAVAAISASIPEDITHDTRRLHTELDDGDKTGHFELQGTVASIAERDTIAGALEEHRCVTELEKGRTTPGPGNEGLNYQVEGTLKCPSIGGGSGDDDE